MPEMQLQPVPNGGWDDRVHLFQLGRLVTTFAIVSQRYVVLLDTLINTATATQLLHEIKPLLGDRQLLVINTHADWDHCWGNAVFAGPEALHPAPIIAHRLCRERLLSGEAQAKLHLKRTEDPATFGDVRLEPPTLAFDGSFTIDGGDLTFELVHTPGHQPDHIAVWLPEIRALFVGDAAEVPMPYIANPHTLPELRATLQKLHEFRAQTVFYCHARGHASPSVIADNIAYFDRLEGQIRAALRAERVPEDLDDIPDAPGLIAFPFADVPNVAGLEADETAAFAAMHDHAIRAAITYFRAGA